jgi:hypothetical protein
MLPAIDLVLSTEDPGPGQTEHRGLDVHDEVARTRENVVMIKTYGGKLNPIGNGNERLSEETMDLLKAVHDDTVYDFLVAHPRLDRHQEGLNVIQVACSTACRR